MEVRLARNSINAIAEQDEVDDDDDVPQNEMDGPKKSRNEGPVTDTKEVRLCHEIFIIIPQCVM